MTRTLNTMDAATAKHIYSTVARRVANLAMDAAAYAIACVCDRYPRLDERREIHILRMKLAESYATISRLEAERDDYKAMHELQHGPTVHLHLTPPDNSSDPHDLN